MLSRSLLSTGNAPIQSRDLNESTSCALCWIHCEIAVAGYTGAMAETYSAYLGWRTGSIHTFTLRPQTPQTSESPSIPCVIVSV